MRVLITAEIPGQYSVTLVDTERDNCYEVHYGDRVTMEYGLGDAMVEFDSCVRHAMAGNGLFDV